MCCLVGKLWLDLNLNQVAHLTIVIGHHQVSLFLINCFDFGQVIGSMISFPVKQFISKQYELKSNCLLIPKKTIKKNREKKKCSSWKEVCFFKKKKKKKQVLMLKKQSIKMKKKYLTSLNCGFHIHFYALQIKKINKNKQQKCNRAKVKGK